MCNKVSVVVPVYNAEKYIEACIQSVLDQDYPNIELVLINDGSRDGSGAVCERYAEKYENIIYSAQENSGVSSARNKGIALSGGEYIMFVDSDDSIKSNMVSKLVRSLEDNDADLSICGYELLRSDGLFPISVEPSTAEGSDEIASFFAEHFLEAVASSPCCKLYKRSLISEGFDPELSMGEDLLFNLGYIKNIKKVASISDTLYIYDRGNGNSITNNYKAEYHIQNIFVFGCWLSWLNEFSNVDDTRVHCRIVRSCFKNLFGICAGTVVGNKLEAVEDMYDENVVSSIRKSIGCFDGFHRFILHLILRRKYRTVIFIGTVYCKIKALRS